MDSKLAKTLKKLWSTRSAKCRAFMEQYNIGVNVKSARNV